MKIVYTSAELLCLFEIWLGCLKPDQVGIFCIFYPSHDAEINIILLYQIIAFVGSRGFPVEIERKI